ncbi:hypothetical protein JHK82_053797 [Glycine max]|uniref:Uncharacterized protein n=1 Tax=Glycine max TaxID=3847 RepID=K7MYN5_SOYBN|nr:hypothetical protein JHK87_053708 [Glycine soja]KAG4928111.1 hypothetical protein JHK85_054597 [Glycine max]KAG5086400.1 hypothetical protein JHK82_053797 [Glycine max]
MCVSGATYHLPFTFHTIQTSHYIPTFRHPKTSIFCTIDKLVTVTARDGILLQDDPLHNATNNLHHFGCFSSIWSS